jgi:hypothetical protein
MFTPLVALVRDMPLKRKILFHSRFVLSNKRDSRQASPTGNHNELADNYLSPAPHALPQAAGFSSGLSEAPHAAGFSSGLSDPPHAVPQAEAVVT